jgi:sugar phosphate isomerase/epimerase
MTGLDRRTFVRGAGALAGAAAVPGWAEAQAKPIKLTAKQAARLSITTACFRHNLDPAVGEAAKTGPRFDMLGVPKFLKDTFGLVQIEVWNRTVPDQSIDYAKKMRASAEAVGSRVLQVQIDGDYDLSALDDKRRADSVAFAKRWMDFAAAAGAKSVRINIGGGARGAPLALEPALASFHDLIPYGMSIGIEAYTENHGTVGGNVDNCLAFMKALNDPKKRCIVDWGISNAADAAGKRADIARLYPYLALVSAKGIHFDKNYNHVDYPIAPLVKDAEATGFRGVYSIELYNEPDYPEDVVAAVRSMIAGIAPNLKA